MGACVYKLMAQILLGKRRHNGKEQPSRQRVISTSDSTTANGSYQAFPHECPTDSSYQTSIPDSDSDGSPQTSQTSMPDSDDSPQTSQTSVPERDTDGSCLTRSYMDNKNMKKCKK